MIGLFKNSKDNNQKIIIFYMDKDNKITQRFVRVLTAKSDCITAYCYYRKQVRTFKLNNLLAADIVRKKVSA